jgi:hypothetical protein
MFYCWISNLIDISNPGLMVSWMTLNTAWLSLKANVHFLDHYRDAYVYWWNL